MMDVVREWLLGVLCAAVAAALVEHLAPEKAVGSICRMAGGILLLIAVVRPILHVDMGTFAAAVVPTWSEITDSQMAGEDLALIKNIIGEETGAYILDKAESLGIPCTQVVVTCDTKDNVPYPSAVQIFGPLGEEQRCTLSRVIESELAIPEQRQTYESEDHTS